MNRIIQIIIAVAIVGMVGYGFFGKKSADTPMKISYAAYSSEIAAFAAIADAASSADAASEDDYQKLSALSGDLINIDFGTFSQSNGAAIARDVTMTFAGMTEMGLKIDELRMWGVDADGMGALMDRTRTEDVLLADRIEATGISYFGMEQFLTTVNKEMTTAMVESMGIEDENVIEQMQSEYGKYTLTIDRIVMNGVTLHALDDVLSLNDSDSVWDYVKVFSSWYRGMSVDNAVYYGMTTEMAMNDATMQVDATYTIPMLAMRGLSRGDLDYTIYTGMNGSMKMLGNDDEVDIDFNITYSLDAFEMADLRLSGVLDYLVQGQLPPNDVTDILSFGLWDYYGLNYKVNDNTVVSSGHVSVDLREFHWFIPTKIDINSSDFVIDLEGIRNAMAPIIKMAANANDASAEEFANIDTIINDGLAILRANDLAQLNFSGQWRAEWSAETGSLQLLERSNLNGFGGYELNFSAVIPSYDRIMTAVNSVEQPIVLGPVVTEPTDQFIDIENDILAPLETNDLDDSVDFTVEVVDDTPAWVAALGPVFLEDSVFNSASISLIDQGGIDKSFAMAVAFSKYIPESEQSPQLQMLKQSDPEQLKNGIAALIRLGGSAAAQEFPPATAYIGAFADFIMQGGTYTVSLTPAEPLTVQAIEGFIAAGEPTPDSAVAFIGLAVTHKAPAVTE